MKTVKELKVDRSRQERELTNRIKRNKMKKNCCRTVDVDTGQKKFVATWRYCSKRKFPLVEKGIFTI